MLFSGTVPAKKVLFARTVPTNNLYVKGYKPKSIKILKGNYYRVSKLIEKLLYFSSSIVCPLVSRSVRLRHKYSQSLQSFLSTKWKVFELRNANLRKNLLRMLALVADTVDTTHA